MVNHYEPIPTEYFKVKNWLIERYAETQEVWCNSPEGKTFIIKLSTYEFPNIPKYVQKKLYKSGFLEAWIIRQANEAVTRLSNAVETYRKFLENRQDMP